MKSGDTNKLAAIRLIKSKITYKDKEVGTETDMTGIIGVLSGMSTAAIETEKEVREHGREDLALKQRIIVDTIKLYLQWYCYNILSKIRYMPTQLAREDIIKEAQATIEELNATSIRDIRKVIAALVKKLGTKAQPQQIGDIARELFSKPKQ